MARPKKKPAPTGPKRRICHECRRNRRVKLFDGDSRICRECAPLIADRLADAEFGHRAATRGLLENVAVRGEIDGEPVGDPQRRAEFGVRPVKSTGKSFNYSLPMAPITGSVSSLFSSTMTPAISSLVRTMRATGVRRVVVDLDADTFEISQVQTTKMSIGSTGGGDGRAQG